MTNDTPTSEPEAPAGTTGSSQPLAAELLTASALPATTAGPTAAGPRFRPLSVTDAMTSGHDQPVRSADIISPHPEPGRPQRRVAMLLAAAAPLAAAAWVIAPAGAAFATAAPPAATHASAVLTGSDCLAAFGGHQAPKLPECLGD